MHARHPKAADGASGEEEPRSKVREVADANVAKKLETEYSLEAIFFAHLVTFKVHSTSFSNLCLFCLLISLKFHNKYLSK